MKYGIMLLLLFTLANCAGLKEAQQARRVAKARKVLDDYKAATPPEDQLRDLVAEYPALEGKTVRVVTKHDTVRVPGATVTVTLPALSTPAADNALVDSLMRSAAAQLHAKDSLAYAARLRAILAARPKLRRDTLVQKLGPLTVKTWVDKQGRPHTTVTSAPQKFGYAKETRETGPVAVKKELGLLERFWIFIKDATGVIIGFLVGAGLVWLFFFIQRQRARKPADEPLPF